MQKNRYSVPNMRVYATNRKAKFDYEILETFEAGLMLQGQEVKSVRGGHITLTGSFVTFRGDIPQLTNSRVSPYPQANGTLPADYDPERSRPILLNRQEINYLRGKLQTEGLTIIPLSIYTKGRHIKVEIALARGKKKYDKREAIKRREIEREISRKLKSF